MKNGSEPSNIYSFSRRIRIRIQNWNKTTPKPDFLKSYDFYVFFSFLYKKGPLGAHVDASNDYNFKKLGTFEGYGPKLRPFLNVGALKTKLQA